LKFSRAQFADMSRQTVPRGEQRTVNFYRVGDVELCERVERAAREKYDADDEAQGVVIGQVFADWLGEPGPLDGEV
jgi:hypothetical protein